MKLEAINIRRLRSIEHASVQKCGQFNVLIGKNNSGKSNVLSAIHAFFACIKGGNVAILNPPVGQDIDFFNRKTEMPIEIILTFSLSLAERDVLIRDIVNEAPQMKNAVDGLDPSLRLSITVSIGPPPDGFGYVSKIALVSNVKATKNKADSERIILTIGHDAGVELYEKMKAQREESRKADLIRGLMRNIDSDDWYRFRKEFEREQVPVEYLFRRYMPRGKIDSITTREIQSLIMESTSFEEYKSAVTDLATRAEERVAIVKDKKLTSKVGTFSGEESAIPIYATNNLRRLSELKILHLTERRKPIGKDEAERLLRLKVRRGGPELLRSIQETVSALLGVQIDAFEGPLKDRTEGSRAEMDVDNFLVEVNGSGIREALRLLLDVEFEDPHIILVEEPEIHLHPALETSMMRYLKRISTKCQIFISTHSTNFLDTAEMKNVYLISKNESTRVQLLDLEEAETHIPRELGIRLSSLFMFDRLVFVEGPYDEDIIREWASTLAVNLSSANVGFVHMGGVRNFTHFAAESTLSFLTKRQVQMWFILDRDEKDDSEVVKLQELMGNKSKVIILKKREIENYLICPRAIMEFINLKRKLSGQTSNGELLDEADIVKKIQECSENLKDLSIEKRVLKIVCKPCYPPTREITATGKKVKGIQDKATNIISDMIKELEEAKNSTEAIYKEQCALVDNDWPTKKLNVVPGSRLLDMVCQQYGVRFKKDRDGSRLAALFQQEEIDKEIKDIVSEIGK